MNFKNKIAILGILFVTISAGAKSNTTVKRLEGRNFTCKQLTALVKSEGLVYIRSATFGGYVASSSKKCQHPSVGPSTINESSYLPAKDTIFCNPGRWCRPKDRWT